MFFSPISEIAFIGRNPPYIISLLMFFVISIITAVVADKSFAALIVLRFLQGFYGSPILASGGASLEDIYDWNSVPYAFIFWIAAMYCGPALGPLMSAYAVPYNWRWSLWEIVIMAGVVLVFFFPTLPETSRPNILFRRAQRLRKATGNQNYRSRAELTKFDAMGIFIDAMTKPLEILVKDPAIGFACIYGSLVYAIYYSFFEVFPLVYRNIYALTLGGIGLVFLCVIVGCILFASMYALYLYYIFAPPAYGPGVKTTRCATFRLSPTHRPLHLRLDSSCGDSLDRTDDWYRCVLWLIFCGVSMYNLLRPLNVSEVRGKLVRRQRHVKVVTCGRIHHVLRADVRKARYPKGR